jgi:hypothetical protein
MPTRKLKKNLTQSRLRPISSFSYVGLGRKGAKMKKRIGLAAKDRKDRKKKREMTFQETSRRPQETYKPGPKSSTLSDSDADFSPTSDAPPVAPVILFCVLCDLS